MLPFYYSQHFFESPLCLYLLQAYLLARTSAATVDASQKKLGVPLVLVGRVGIRLTSTLT